MKQNEPLQKPFFAQFLESQQPQKSQAGEQTVTLQMVDNDQTLKFPSDSDEDEYN